MIVCSCLGLSHREIDAHVARGCRTVRDLGRACGAGTDCGSCVSDLKARIERLRGRGADVEEPGLDALPSLAAK